MSGPSSWVCHSRTLAFIAANLGTGWTLQQFGFVVSIITSTHFASEAYPSNPGPALVLVVGMKNIVSFGKAYLSLLKADPELMIV